MGQFFNLNVASFDAFLHSLAILVLIVSLDLNWIYYAWQKGQLENDIKKYFNDNAFISQSAGLYFSLLCTIANGIYYYYHKGKRVKTYFKYRLILLALTICCYRFKEPKTRTKAIKSREIIISELIYLFISCVGATALVEKMEDLEYYKIQTHHMDIVGNPARWRLGGIPLKRLLYFQAIFNFYFPGMQVGYYLKRINVPQLKLGIEEDVAYQTTLIVTFVISTALALNSITLITAMRKKSKGILLAYYYIKLGTIFPLRFCIMALIQKEDELTNSPEFPVPGIFVLALSYVFLFDLAQILRFHTYLSLRTEMTVEELRLQCQNNSEYLLKGVGPVSFDFFDVAKSNKETQRIVQSVIVAKWKIIFDGDKIGEGNFALVFKGHLRNGLCFKESPVAIKIMKNEIGLDYLHSIVSELKTLRLVGKHENLALFLGICKCKNPESVRSLGILTEFCEGGNLLDYLKELKGLQEMSQLKKIQTLQTALKIWSLEIAQGMEYLGTKGVIHADLAARNVLLTANLTAKITDFGMSLRIYHYQTYAKSNQSMFPFKSMSPESLIDLKFTFQSDVYSYGVLIWEIFTLGEAPWGDLIWNSEFPKSLMEGMRLPQPEMASKMLYHELMLKCWEVDPKSRPSFNSIVSYFENRIDRNQILTKKQSKEPCI